MVAKWRQSAQRGTIFIQGGSESRTQKSSSPYGNSVWGNFNMAAETAAQLKWALRINNVCMKAFEPRIS